MSDRPAREFWQSVALKLILIWLVGWAVVLWFRGCVAPAVREEMRQQSPKS